jgi:hypothetical protein
MAPEPLRSAIIVALHSGMRDGERMPSSTRRGRSLQTCESPNAYPQGVQSEIVDPHAEQPHFIDAGAAIKLTIHASVSSMSRRPAGNSMAPIVSFPRGMRSS